MRSGAHRGALLFTLAVALVAIALVGPQLATPLPTSLPAAAADASYTEEIDVADLRTPLPAELHAEWYTQTVPPVLRVGDAADITIQLRNVGHTAWIKGTPSELRLGEVGARPLPPEMRVDWLRWDRPAAQTEAIVHERQIATFSFTIAGVAPGTFRLDLRPVVDGVAWLEDHGLHVEITVRR